VRLALVIAALLGALAVVLGFVLTREDDEPSFRGSVPPEGLTLPTAVADSPGVAGKALAVTFLDTQCTEACPIAASQVAEAMRLLGEDRGSALALAFSVDPLNDTPKSIRDFLAKNRATGEIRYVDGSVAELRPIWTEFKIMASHGTGNSNMHSAPVRVYDAEGRWRSTLHPGFDLTATNLANDLRAALGRT
jgi:cytochrome oxidase Cu insertion factor (SCO1/SenC/PrrC family)